MIEALTSSTLWGSLGLFVLATWAACRIAGHLTHGSDAGGIVVLAALPMAAAFAVSFVLTARFPAWRVVLGLAVAGIVVVTLFTAGGQRRTSGQDMAGLGMFIAALYVAILVPVAMAIPALLAWLAHRHPPTRLGWGIAGAVIVVAWVAPSVDRLRSALRTPPFLALAQRAPLDAARLLIRTEDGAPDHYGNDPILRPALARLPVPTLIELARGGESANRMAQEELAKAARERAAETLPLLLAATEAAGGAKASGEHAFLFRAVAQPGVVDDPRVRAALLARLADGAIGDPEEAALVAGLSEATADRAAVASGLVDAQERRTELSWTILRAVGRLGSRSANARLGRWMAAHRQFPTSDDEENRRLLQTIARDAGLKLEP